MGMGPSAPGMPGMPGAPGMGGGTALTWSETPADPRLTMTYPEYLQRRGLNPLPVPEGLLREPDGTPKKRTDAAWAQLESVYAGVRRPEELGPPKPGRVGGALWRQAQEQLAVTKKEMMAVLRAATAAAGGFTFEIGYPQYDPRAVTESGVTVRVGVLMHVKPSLQKSYGATIYRLLKPFDNYGVDRVPFTFVTYQGGYFHPHTFTLRPESVNLWNTLWSTGASVVLALRDSNGQLIEAGITNAGFSGNAPTLIAYPPEVRRTPYFDYLMPNADRTFDGRRMGLDFSRGWYYEFTFNLSMDELRRIDKASATVLMPPYSVLAEAVSGAKTLDQILPDVQRELMSWMDEKARQLGAQGAPAAAGPAGGPGGAIPPPVPGGAPGAPPPPPGPGMVPPVGPGYQTPPVGLTAPVPL